MTAKSRHRKGSVIVLVVGLLVMLAMIGGTFVIIAFLDRRESRSLAIAAPMNKVAGGVLDRVVAALRDDLYCGDPPDGRPYQNATKWSQVIDFASEDCDRHLASYHAVLPDASGGFYHITNIDPGSFTGANDRYYFTRVPAQTLPGGQLTQIKKKYLDEQGNTVTGLSSRYYVDVDADGKTDSILLDSGMNDRSGLTYYYAVRVVDLGGLVNVNTAYGPTHLLPTRGVPAIDLTKLPDTGAAAVTATIAGYIHDGRTAGAGQGRCGTGAADDDSFNKNLAARLPAPAGGYLPYDQADELGCRWTGDVPNTRIGRLAINLDAANTAKNRKFLTVYNADRTYFCQPLPDAATNGLVLLNMDWPKPDNFPTKDYTDDTKVQMVAQKLFDIFKTPSPLNPTGDKDRAAHLAINCAAFRKPPGVWMFNPSDPDKYNMIYYGVQDNQPVIAEAYAKASKDFQVYAVELFNPGPDAIPLNDRPNKNYYTLGVNGTSIALTGNLAPGGRLVVYSKSGLPPVTFFALDPSVTNTLQDNALRLAKGNMVTLIWTKDDKSMPVDQVLGEEVGNVDIAALPPDNLTAIGKDARRDDNPTLARYNVARYKPFDVNVAVTDHTLGLPNGVDGKDFEPELNYGAKVYLAHADFTDLGQLSQVYFVGTRADTTGMTHVYRTFPEALASAETQDCPTRGRLCLLPEDATPPEIWQRLPGTKWTIGAPGAQRDYPPIPLACFLTEYINLLRTDSLDPLPTPNPADPPVRGPAGARVYGRININTAPLEVLKCLPWPTSQVDQLCKDIIAYREKTDFGGLTNWSRRQKAVPAGQDPDDLNVVPVCAIGNLRRDPDPPAPLDPPYPVDIRGFLTAGEVAIPAAVFMKQFNDDPKAANYQAARDSAFINVSNLVTVRSEVYAAYIMVLVGKADPSGATTPDIRTVRRYVAVIDRSNCTNNTQQPRVLMFTELK